MSRLCAASASSRKPSAQRTDRRRAKEEEETARICCRPVTVLVISYSLSSVHLARGLKELIGSLLTFGLRSKIHTGSYDADADPAGHSQDRLCTVAPFSQGLKELIRSLSRKADPFLL